MLSTLEEWKARYTAISVPPVFHLGRLLWHGNLIDKCGPGPRDHQCTFWQGRRQLDPEAMVVPTTGMHIQIVAEPRYQEPDDMGLVQAPPQRQQDRRNMEGIPPKGQPWPPLPYEKQKRQEHSASDPVIGRRRSFMEESGRNTTDETSMMQRERSRSRNGSNHTHPMEEEEESDPEARSSNNASQGQVEDVNTWTFLTPDMDTGRHDVPQSQDRPSPEDAAQALGLATADIQSIQAVPHLINERDEYIALVLGPQHAPLTYEQVLIYVEVMCMHDQPISTVPRLPSLFHLVRVVPHRTNREGLAQALQLGTLAYSYPWHVILDHNGVTWEVFDQRPRFVSNGDYVVIRLAPHQSSQHRANLTDWLLDNNFELWESLAESEPNSAAASSSIPTNRLLEPETPDSNAACAVSVGFPGIQVHSWYVSHTRHRRCTDSRLLVLSADSNTWQRDIERLWGDVMERGTIFALHWVMPPPFDIEPERTPAATTYHH